MSAKEYDVLLFGVTGFTGKLALEHLLEQNYAGLNYPPSIKTLPE